MTNELTTNIRPWEHQFDNYEKYEAYTRSNDWLGICYINGRNIDSLGTKKELAVLSGYLEKGEVVFALSSGIMKQTETSNSFDFGSNTWLVALTSERFLFLDHAMLTKSVDTQSVRHDHVQAVSASQGMILGKIIIDLGSRTIVVDNCQKGDVKVMAGLANKWLRLLDIKKKNQSLSTQVTQASQTTKADAIARQQIRLAQIQIKNQEKIILLLENINSNMTRNK